MFKLSWSMFGQKQDWLWHIVVMLVMSAIVATLFYPVIQVTTLCAIFGIGWGIGHYHGRERRDCEVKLKMPPPHMKSFWFGYWNYDQLTDFFPVVAAGTSLLASILYW